MILNKTIQRLIYLFSLMLLPFGAVNAQDTYKRNNNADVQHYRFDLTVNDDSNEILGQSFIKVKFEHKTDTFALDLIGKSNHFGMEILEVLEDATKANYTYHNNKIMIIPNLDEMKERTYSVKYKGIPEKGLVMDTTMYGQRSFFGDNWPNLARYWLACVDHPYDKASVSFNVYAPEYYDVVATGTKTEESNLGNGMKLTSYNEPAPVATKVMTIGVTKFAYSYLGKVGDIEVSAWVYPENRLEGFVDFEEATKILEYFNTNIGSYSYAKLANMQAKTQWGGLENAGTISYKEALITGNKEIQELMAHEIAHQWFGNSATENDWNHVWLSEGFATYFAILYQESVDGNEKRKTKLLQDKNEVIEYYQKNPSPIVDSSIKDPKKVLSRNTYQKGGWVLNMLRHQLGDKVFWEGIKRYYAAYKDSNAMSSDFQKIMEEVSGKELNEFFEQWLYVKGYPELKWGWKYKKGKLQISVKQLQKHHMFTFPIEFGVKTGDDIKIISFDAKNVKETFEIVLKNKPESVVIDPEVWLLFEEK
jgi:aminopeptidase N